MTAIPVIGPGAKGSTLAQCLLSHGHRVTLWNRTPERAAPLVAALFTTRRACTFGMIHGAPVALPQVMRDLTNDALRDGYGDRQLTALVEQMLKDG